MLSDRAWWLSRDRQLMLCTLVLASLLPCALAGCGRAAPRIRSASVPRTVGWEQAAPGAQHYAVPGSIGAAYVQSVMDALDSLDGDAMATIAATRSLDPGALARIRAITTAPFFDEQTSILATQLGSGFSYLRDDPGPPVDHVVRVVSSSRSCIFASVSRDLSALERAPEREPLNYVTLRPLQRADDPGGLNPTPWALDFLGFEPDGSPVPDQCHPTG
jgi:hypothetical protein